jgi:hypothetical protein
MSYSEWMRCFFCYSDGEVPRLSKEHLVSRPVAVAFGLDRASSFGRAGNNDSSISVSRLDNVAVKVACDRCNNGWMNDLEQRMVAVGEWADTGSSPLSPTILDSLCSWALKTYFVLSAIEGGIRKFGDGESDYWVIPDVTRARQLYEGKRQAFEGVTVGLAQCKDVGRFAYVFGNPTVVPQGPRYANLRSAGSAIIALGHLQIWIVVPLSLFRHAKTRLPSKVCRASVGLRFKELKSMPLVPRLENIVVDNGEHDIIEIFDRLQRWAEAQQ